LIVVYRDWGPRIVHVIHGINSYSQDLAYTTRGLVRIVYYVVFYRDIKDLYLQIYAN